MNDKLKTGRIPRDFIQSRRYADDEFFSVALDGACGPCEEILRAILGDPCIKVHSVQVQRYLSQLGGHAVRLDILAENDQGVMFNVEIQLLGDPDPKRGRYYGASVDTSVLRKGTPYSALPDVYIIFIMGRDPYGLGRSVYHVDQTVRETGEPYFDGRHVLFANLEYEGNDAVGRLMHDLKCTVPADMYNTELAERMRFLKDTPEGEAIVSEGMQQLIEENSRALREQILKKDEALKQQGEVLRQKDEALAQKDEALKQQGEALKKKDEVLTQKDEALKKKEEEAAALRRLLQELGVKAPSFG